jgi:serine/threonine protein kinase
MRDPNRRRRWDQVAIKATAPTILDVRSGPLETCEDLERNCNEIKTLLRLQQPSDPRDSPVLHLYEYFWTYLGGDGSKNRPVGELILVTEHLGQDLDQWWRQEQQKSNGLIFESVAREISETLVGALDFIHRHKIVHRDIKMQNVMFRRNGDYRSLKVIDFGLAKVLEHDKAQANDFCGTKGYIAPEIYLGQPYGYEVDMFALGVMAFRLLSGNRPFHSNNANKLASDTINLRYTIMDNVWDGVTAEALHFVRKLLIGRDERLTASLAVQHEWFRSREESVLHSDYSNFAPTGSYSRAIVRTHVPAADDGPQSVGATTTVNRFWLDDRLYVPINILQIYNLYAGRIVNNNIEEQKGDNLILLEEVTNHSLTPLPIYLGQLKKYNERECRRICRQAAQIVQILHSNKMAHRNIHLGSFLVDTKVRFGFV